MPNAMYDHNDSSTGKVDSANFNPMQIADARRAAEQAIQPSIDAIEAAGGNVNSPEFRGLREQITQQLSNEILKQSLNNIRNTAGSERSKKAEGGDAGEGEATAAGGEAGAGGEVTAGGLNNTGGASSIFEAIAFALGSAMENKVNELLAAADQVQTATDGGVLLASAQVTARGQELNVISQAFNSTINSVGQAASTAARKQ